MLSKLDTNSDNSISRDEFIAGKPKDASTEKAGSLFDKLDSQKTGSLSLTDMASAFQQMASTMQSSLLSAQEARDGDWPPSPRGDGKGPPDPGEMFGKLDSDGDGTVTRAEFVAGRPDQVNETQAGAFFDDIAGSSSSDGLTQDQFVEGMKKAGPPDGGQQAGGMDLSSLLGTARSEASSQTNQLLEQLLKAIGAYGKTATSGSSVSQPA
jgi:Ca2+-binding EF-hand superfamily protein